MKYFKVEYIASYALNFKGCDILKAESKEEAQELWLNEVICRTKQHILSIEEY